MAEKFSNTRDRKSESADGSLVAEVDALLECAICTEVMTLPKILPCTHSFCLECLKKYVCKKENTRKKNTCPICRAPFPSGKVMSLPDNLLAKKFLELREKIRSGSSDEVKDDTSMKWCENCLDKDERNLTEAIKHCEQCEQRLCLGCVEAHKSLKITSRHSLVDLVIPKKDEPLVTPCPLHPSCQATNYCEDCQCYACQDCAEDCHSTHITIDLDRFVSGLNTESQLADSRAEHLKRMIELNNETKFEFLERIARTESTVHREADRLRALINEGETELLHQLETFKKKLTKESATYVDGAEMSVLVLRGCVEKLTELSRMSTDIKSISRALEEAEQLKQETRGLVGLRQARPRFPSEDLKIELVNKDHGRSNFIGEIRHNWKDVEATDIEKANGLYGCAHYKRRCRLLTSCCSQIYSCRLCHDENEDHKLVSTQVEAIQCQMCGTEQPVARWCRNCDVEFGRYYCATCRLYDETDKGQFHCDKCGICRVGGRHNFWHCDLCGLCINKISKRSHMCLEGAAFVDCQICKEAVFDSIESLKILSCGHVVHQKCFKTRPDLRWHCLSCYESK